MYCHKIINSIFNSCTYIVFNDETKEAIAIDCGDFQPISDYLSSNNLKLIAVFITHSHFDHIYGIPQIVKANPSAFVYVSKNGIEGLKNPKYNLSRYQSDIPEFSYNPQNVFQLNDGDEIQIAGLEIKVMSTEGHDWSCLSYIIGNCLFTGDSYIPGIRVVDTWPKSDKRKAKDSFIKLTILESKGLKVMAGHAIKE